MCHSRARRCVRNAGAPVTSVRFDNSGQYLAVGGMDARIYGVKQEWQLLSTLSDLPQKVPLAYLSDTPIACNHVCLLCGDLWHTGWLVSFVPVRIRNMHVGVICHVSPDVMCRVHSLESDEED